MQDLALHRFPRLFTVLLSAVLLLTFPACDSGDDDGDGGGGGGGNLDGGEFSATFGGDLDGSFNGNAFFAVVEDDEIPGGRGFVLFLTDADIGSGATQFTEYIWFVRLGDRPGTGSYDITDAETENDGPGTLYALYSSLSSGSTGASVVSRSGTLTITSSSSERVRGSFNFEGEGFDLSGGGEPISATFSGNFDAIDLGNGIPIFAP